MDIRAFQHEITTLKKSKNAILLAHYYQRPEIQEIADFTGDSLALAQYAEKSEADILIMAGVYFMAETAVILNPTMKVLIPDVNAGCSLADSCPLAPFLDLKSKYPEAVTVSYINCSAEIKAHSDYICTSSNALKIIKSIREDQPILFVPDRNLGHYLTRATGRDMVIWDGACEVHEAFSKEKVKALQHLYPDAKLAVHPESEPWVIDMADFTGSTTGIINYVKASPNSQFLIGTEVGILHTLKDQVPEKKLIPLPINENNTCACSECRFMKEITLEKIYYSLRDLKFEVKVDPEIARKALIPLHRMLQLS